MLRFVFASMLLFTTAASLALSQDDSSEAVAGKAKEAFGVNGSYAKAEFSKVWAKLTNEARRVKTLSGRVWIREYSAPLWDDVAVKKEPIVSFPPERAFLCDFASDFVEMRTRQDWYDVSDTKIDFLANFTFDNRMFLDLSIPDSLRLRERRIRSSDREVRFLKTHIRIQVPERLPRSWPTILDYRLAGWTSAAQWMGPTNMEQWLRVLDSYEPFSVATDDFGDTVVTQYNKSAGTKCIWQMAFDSKSWALKSVFQYRVVNQLADGTLVCVKGPLFRSVIFSEPKSKRKCVVLGSEASSLIQRLDFVVEEDDFLGDDLFEPESLSPATVPITYSPELEAIIAAELGKGSLPTRP